MSENKTTFWKYLQKHDIEIPILQRDYAQGRPGQEYLRKNFLISLRNALNGTLPYNQKELKLDFVYGANEDDTMQPLDGQQRLTTLWLLHWYIALRAGQLEKAEAVLKKFTYETRMSSREFCKKLCNSHNFKDWKHDSDIKTYIETQTWFYTDWLKDPTIAAMLLMLTGTNISLEDVDQKDEQETIEKNALSDGIEKCFNNAVQQDFENYWNILISDHCPIFFYHLPLKDFGLSDDLYIKMNARGKQLTAFENFKADLIGYIRYREKEKVEGLSIAKADHDEDWKSLLDVSSGIPINLDTSWTSIFWNNRSSLNSIDDIYFAFLSRFFWNSLFVAKKEGKYILKVGKGTTEIGTESNTIENENMSYRYLNDDIASKYADLSPYRFYDGEIPFSTFTDLEKVLDRYAEMLKLYSKEYTIPGVSWENDKPFEFIPRYLNRSEIDDNVEISVLTQQQRVLFYAVVKYLLDGEADNISLKRWMRVVYNLISGTDNNNRVNLRTPALVRNAIEIIQTLDSHNVLECLYDTDIIDNPNDIEKRLNSEIEKARQILTKDDNCRYRIREYEGPIKSGGKTLSTWEEIITDAEAFSFFRGYIRFLYQDADGKVNWDDFDIKYSFARCYFRENLDSNDKALNPEYDNEGLLQSLFSNITPDLFQTQIWYLRRYTFRNDVSSWRYYLENEKLAAPLHTLLMGDNSVKILKDSDNPNTNEHILKLLSNTTLLAHVLNKLGNGWIRDYHNHYAIYPSGPGVFLNAKRRDSFLSTFDIFVADDFRVEGTNLFQGSDINFVYKGKNYQWYRDNRIYLMKDEDPFIYDYYTAETENGENKEYYFFETSDMDEVTIKNRLEQLVQFRSSLLLN